MPAPNSANSPFHVLTFGDANTILNPGLEDKPGKEAYRFDTYHKLKEANVIGVYNQNVPIFTVAANGDVIFTGGVTIPPGGVQSAPLLKEFPTPITTWTWNHNLGFKPLTMVLDGQQKMMMASVQHVDDDTIQVEHAYAVTGSIRIR